MKLSRYKLIVVLLCFSLTGKAQQYFSKPGYFIKAGYERGQILKHDEQIKKLEAFGANSVLLDFAFQSDTSLFWAPHHSFPFYGVSLIYSDFEANSIGKSLASVAFLEKTLPITPKFLSLNLHFGLGLGYVQHVYNKVENPRNLAVSSHLNVAVDIRAGVQARLMSNLALVVQGGLQHFSNAATKRPNYGLNLMQLSTSLKYTFGQDVFVTQSHAKPKIDHEFLALANAGAKRAFFDSLKFFPVQSIDLEYNLVFDRAHHLGIGMALMNDAIADEYHEWAVHYNYNDGNENIRFATMLTLGPYLNYEFMFGRFSAFLQTGLYISHPFYDHRKNELEDFDRYFKYFNNQDSRNFDHVGFRYRFKNHIVLNLGLKTHMFKAQYLELGIGSYF